MGAGKDGIRRNAISLLDDDGIAAHHFPPSDAPPNAVPDDKGAGAGHVAQSFQNPLAARFLNDRDGDGNGGEGQQNQCLGQVSQEEINHPGAEQQREHGLGQDIANDAQQAALVRPREIVESLRRQATPSLFLAQPLDNSWPGIR